VNNYIYSTCVPFVKYRIICRDDLNGINYISNVDSSLYNLPVYNDSIQICQGDSILLGGHYRSTAGYYFDTLNTFQGCDSIFNMKLIVNPVFSTNANASICNGDSIKIGGQYQKLPGTYVDALQSQLGCDSTVHISLSVVSPDVMVNSNGRILTANATNVNYQWIQCAPLNVLTSETNQVFNPLSNGLYAVIITDGNCSDTSDCFEINSVGIKDLQGNGGISFFPNPANNRITFELEKDNDLPGKLIIYDQIGKVIIQQEISDSRVEIRTGKFSQGVHYFKILSSNGIVYTGNFVVKH